MKRVGEVPVYEVSKNLYDMFTSEYDYVIETGSSYYEPMLLISQQHVIDLTAEHKKMFQEELDQIVFGVGPWAILLKE